MACKLDRPEPQALFNKYLDMFSATVLGGTTVIPETNEWYAVSLNYAMAEEFHALSEQAWKENDPRYASCASLIDMAARDGVFQIPELPAQGYVRLTGEAGSALVQDMVITFGDKKYVPMFTVPTQVPTNGEWVMQIKALIPGPEGNSVPTTTGTLQPAMPGVEPEVQLYGNGLCGGREEETCEQLRARYLNRIQYKPNTNLEKIKEKILEWPCVTSVCETGPACCVYDKDKNVICTPYVELHAMFHGTFPCGIAPECVIDELNLWLFGSPQGMGLGQVPMGVCGKLVPVKPVCIDLTLDGLGCAQPSQVLEIQERIHEFFEILCPSTPIYLRDLETILTQVIGSSQGIAVFMRPAQKSNIPGCDNTGLSFNTCGDAIIECGYKACLGRIDVANARMSVGGCA